MAGRATADAIRVHVSPPLSLRHTREFERWKKTPPAGSRFAGAGTTPVKKPNPTSLRPNVVAAQFWETAGGLLLRFVRMEEPCALPRTVFVFAWLWAVPIPSPPINCLCVLPLSVRRRVPLSCLPPVTTFENRERPATA
jgi:hypothetical protein